MITVTVPVMKSHVIEHSDRDRETQHNDIRLESPASIVAYDDLHDTI